MRRCATATLLASSQGAARLRRGPLEAAAQLARRHAACAVHRRCRLSRVLRPPLQHAAGRGATRYVRDAAAAAAATGSVAGRGTAARLRGARKSPSAAQVARRAVLLRSCDRAASCAPPRARAAPALCTAPGKQLDCARVGGGAHFRFPTLFASSHTPCHSQASAGAPAGPRIKVWVKPEDVPDAQYAAVKDVDPEETVDDFKARWVAKAKLGVDPSLVTLRLVKRGAGEPTAKQEAKAKVLEDPRLTLAAAGVTNGSSMLADAVQLPLLAAEREAEAARQRAEREEEAERQRAERRARRGAQPFSGSTS